MSSALSSPSAIMQNPALAAAGRSMGEFAVAGCIGAASVKRNIVTTEMVRALSCSIFRLLLPLFLGSSVMRTVAGNRGAVNRSSFLAVPIMAAAQSALLLLLSRAALLPLFGIDPASDEGEVLTVACCFGNAGVLPFIFSESLFRHDADLLQRAYAQVSFFSVGWSPFFWSLAPKMLRVSSSSSSATTTTNTTTTTTNTTTTTTGSSSAAITNDSSNDGSNNKENKWTRKALCDHAKVFFPPPVVGILSGLLVGLSPLCPLLLRTSSSGQQGAPPLAVVYNSIQNLGKAASPLGVLVLTCSLALGAGKKKENTTESESSGTSGAGILQKWGCVSAARCLLSPAIMWILLEVMHRINMIDSRQAQPMLWFVCLLQSVMPPAQNTVVLLQVAGRSPEASQLARFLCSVYATAMLPMAALITIALDALRLVPKTTTTV